MWFLRVGFFARASQGRIDHLAYIFLVSVIVFVVWAVSCQSHAYGLFIFLSKFMKLFCFWSIRY